MNDQASLPPVYKLESDEMAIEVVKGEEDDGFPCPHCEKKIRVNITMKTEKLVNRLLGHFKGLVKPSSQM